MDLSVDEFKKMPEKQQKRWRKATEAEIEAHKKRLKKQEIAKAQRDQRAADIDKRNADKKASNNTGGGKGNGKTEDEKAESAEPKK